MGPNSEEQWRELFGAVLDIQGAAERSRFLEANCADPEIRRQVAALLEEHDRLGDFLSSPSAGIASALIQPAMEPMEDRRIGAYRLVRKLGEGGMGAVYLAERADEAFQKSVAIKLLRPGIRSRELIQRFLQERQILAALDHPSIARLLDGGTTPESEPYFVLEYVEGIPIDAYCRALFLPAAERLRLFRRVCKAVEFAHSRGVIHRDLKPGNILVTPTGEPKLLDFGIAKALRPEALLVNSSAAETLAEFRMMTPEYASPEQLQGRPITAATDVYSLGVLLYELLTDTKPYDFPSRIVHEMVRVICEDPPRPPSSRGRPDPVGGDLEEIVLTALRKEPDRRFATVADLRTDLERLEAGLPVSAAPDALLYRIRKFACRNRTGLLAAGVVLLATAIASWQFLRARQFTADAARLRQSPALRTVWAHAPITAAGTVSPDGKYVSLTGLRESELAVRDLATGTVRELAAQAFQSVFSPDSTQVAFTWDENGAEALDVIGVDGRARRTIARIGPGQTFRPTDWKAGVIAGISGSGPDAKLAYVSDSAPLRTVGASAVSAGRVWLSPDGTRLVLSTSGAGGTSDISIVTLATGVQTPLITHPADDYPVAWLPDGRIVFASDRTGAFGLWSIDPSTRLETLVQPNTGPVDPLGAVQDGRLLLGSYTGQSDIFTVDLTAAKPAKLAHRYNGANTFPAWSPDGRTLLFVTQLLQRQASLVFRNEGGGFRLLQPPLVFFRKPSWVGQSVFVSGNDGQVSGVFAIDTATGAARLRVSEQQLESPFAPVWARDGSFLLSRFHPPRRGIYRMASGAQAKQVLWKPTETGAPGPGNPALSPDQKRIAFTVRGLPAGQNSLWVMNSDGGPPRQLMTVPGPVFFGAALDWTADSRQILVSREADGASELWIVPADSGAPGRLFPLPLPGLKHLAVHPDGKRLAFQAGEPNLDLVELQFGEPRP
jgi:Tol biopolymer transport system component